MKKPAIARIMALFLLLCLLTTLFAACRSEEEKPDDATQSTPANTNVVETLPQEAYDYMPEKHDFEKYEFRMLLQTDYHGTEILEYYESQDGLNGDSVSSALYTRNAYLEEQYNIVFDIETTISENRLQNRVSTAASADEDLWDVAFALSGLQHNVHQGDYLDISDVRELNLQASYWDQAIQEEYSINGRIFALEGDYTIYDELRTFVVLYNNKIYEEWNYQNTYGSIYDIVREGDWTYDLMLKMFKDTSISSDGQTLTKDDRWGMIANAYAPHVMFLGSGQKTALSVDGETELMFDDETTFNNAYDTIEYILRTMFVNNKEVLFEGVNTEVFDNDAITGATMFADDKAMFWVSTLYDVLSLRNMESRFGILPIPKYYSGDKQDDYHCYIVAGGHAPMYFLKTAVTQGHLDKTATIAEIMCYYSRYAPNGGMSVYDAFYEKMVLAKLCRTPDDYEMLEIVYASKTYDMDSICNFSRFLNLSHCIVSNTVLKYGFENRYTMNVSFDKLRSSMTALQQTARTTMNTYLESLEKKIVEAD